VYALSATYFFFGTLSLYRFLSPPEYKTQEDKEKSEVKFGLSDMFTRMIGYIRAMRESADNKTELTELRLPRKKD